MSQKTTHREQQHRALLQNMAHKAMQENDDHLQTGDRRTLVKNNAI